MFGDRPKLIKTMIIHPDALKRVECEFCKSIVKNIVPIEVKSADKSKLYHPDLGRFNCSGEYVYNK
jgi:hypothetical protein